MRNLVVTENISLDGVLDGDFYVRAGETAHAVDIDEALRVQREHADALLVGRVTFEAFRSYWPNQTANPSGTSQYLNAVAKYVVSATLAQADLGWDNSTVLRNLDDVRALKEQPGSDIVTTGSVTLVHSLIAAGLVDEYRLFTYPVLVGEGRQLFASTRGELRLFESRAFESGVTLTRYRTPTPSAEQPPTAR
jgi:dihydrofolate reductase